MGPADAYEEPYDFAMFDGKPVQTFMVATVPRSGSTHFCSLLWETGVAGSPLEYFNFIGVHRMRRRFPMKDIAEYYSAVSRVRTSPNGVFGYKLFIPDIAAAAETQPALLDLIRPDVVIYLTRRDVISHAVSYSIASQTGAWFHNHKEAFRPRYSMMDISRHIYSIEKQQADWERTFEQMEVDPLRITYEQLLADEAGTLASVLKRFEITWDGQKIDTGFPRPKQQAGSRNIEWIERYKQETERMRFLYPSPRLISSCGASCGP